MRFRCILSTSLSLISFGIYAQTIPATEVQIKTAVLAAPADQRDSAAVYGYTSSGELTLIRKGTNKMLCLADDPMQKGFSVACYHLDLEPFMTRGRALRKEGKSMKEVFDMREAEVKNGTLKMPAQPTLICVHRFGGRV